MRTPISEKARPNPGIPGFRKMRAPVLRERAPVLRKCVPVLDAHKCGQRISRNGRASEQAQVGTGLSGSVPKWGVPVKVRPDGLGQDAHNDGLGGGCGEPTSHTTYNRASAPALQQKIKRRARAAPHCIGHCSARLPLMNASVGPSMSLCLFGVDCAVPRRRV